MSGSVTAVVHMDLEGRSMIMTGQVAVVRLKVAEIVLAVAAEVVVEVVCSLGRHGLWIGVQL